MPDKKNVVPEISFIKADVCNDVIEIFLHRSISNFENKIVSMDPASYSQF